MLASIVVGCMEVVPYTVVVAVELDSMAEVDRQPEVSVGMHKVLADTADAYAQRTDGGRVRVHC